MTISAKQRQLNQELQEYARSLDLIEYIPNPDDLSKIIQSGFPEYFGSTSSLESIFCELELPVIFRFNGKTEKTYIGCSVTDSMDEAEEKFKRLNQQRYVNLRNNLGIYAHWIIVVPENYLFMCSTDTLMDWFSEFRLANEPSCLIVDELRHQ